MSISDQKKALRKELLERRIKMDDKICSEKSEAISHHFLGSALFSQSNVIHCFVSMNKRREVNTLPLIKQLLAEYKRVVVPVTDFETGTLQHVQITSTDYLKENKWGVLEPVQISDFDISSIDVVLVPLLAADEHGNRLGYGKGFYDRFLNQIKVPKLGLLFQDYVLPNVPVDEFDIPLDGFITENGLRYL